MGHAHSTAAPGPPPRRLTTTPAGASTTAAGDVGAVTVEDAADSAFLCETGWGDDLVPDDFRANLHAIEPRLYLGNVIAASSLETLRGEGITHVVNCLGTEVTLFPTVLAYYTLDIDDTMTEDALRHFYPVTDFIADALAAHPDHRVFIHCAAGVSRSATLTLAYIMRRDHVRAADAYDRVRAVRRIVNPNAAFRRQLVTWQWHILRDAPLPASAARHPASSALCALATYCGSTSGGGGGGGGGGRMGDDETKAAASPAAAPLPHAATAAVDDDDSMTGGGAAGRDDGDGSGGGGGGSGGGSGGDDPPLPALPQ